MPPVRKSVLPPSTNEFATVMAAAARDGLEPQASALELPAAVTICACVRASSLRAASASSNTSLAAPPRERFTTKCELCDAGMAALAIHSRPARMGLGACQAPLGSCHDLRPTLNCFCRCDGVTRGEPVALRVRAAQSRTRKKGSGRAVLAEAARAVRGAQLSAHAHDGREPMMLNTGGP